MNMSRLLATAVTAAIALPTLTLAGPAPAPTYSSEKCYGVAAKGGNDCGTSTHSCAGESTKAKDASSWIYVPAGTCKKIEGGTTKS